MKSALARAQRARERNRIISNRVKLERGCEACGFRGHHAALDFDHREPSEKALNIGGTTCSVDRLLAEIEKCRVLCANCHRVHSYNAGHHRRAS